MYPLLYDANALYLSTMLMEMPCWKGKVVHCTNRDVGTSMRLADRLKNRSWFGFAEVDVEIPERLWPKFEMCPFFYNKQVPENVVPQHMVDYLQRTGRNHGKGKKLVGALSAEKLLVYAPYFTGMWTTGRSLQESIKQ